MTHGWTPTVVGDADQEATAHAERKAWRATHSLEARIVKLETAVAELQVLVRDLRTETDEVEVELTYLHNPHERWVPGDGVTTPDEYAPDEPEEPEIDWDNTPEGEYDEVA